MPIARQIEVWMTVAFLFYLAAFFLARKAWHTHIILAVCGFIADMYATWLMVGMSRSGTSFWTISHGLQFHTLMAFVAIIAFLLQAGLGLRLMSTNDIITCAKYWKYHTRSAKYVFLPIWVLTYGSGFALAFH